MPRPKGSQNKITSEVKDKLQLLIDDLIASLNVNDLDANQRIKMLQVALQYTLPRLQATVIKDDIKDLPLFIEDIVVHTRKEDSDEQNWKDNFEVSSIHKIPK